MKIAKAKQALKKVVCIVTVLTMIPTMLPQLCMQGFAEEELPTVEETETEKQYSLEGEKNTQGDWYRSGVTVKAEEGYLLAEQADAQEWAESLLFEPEDGQDIELIFFVKDIESGTVSEAICEKINKDSEKPQIVIKTEEISSWEKLFTIIRFKPDRECLDVEIEASDTGSGVRKKEYLFAQAPMTEEELAAQENWTEYAAPISLREDSDVILYARAVDNAGNYGYAATNEILFDTTAPTLETQLLTQSYGDERYFHGDVQIRVQTDDAQPSSGLAEVSYKVYCDGAVTQEGTLYECTDDPKREDLKEEWSSDDLTVLAGKNNSDDVRVEIRTEDLAGNATEETIPLRISIHKPVINVTWQDQAEKVRNCDGIDYYNVPRSAKIEITGRTSLFDESLAQISVQAKDAQGADKTGTYTMGSWSTEAAENGNPDEAKHSVMMQFTGNANYSFSVSYTDKAEQKATEYSSERFAVDRDKPRGSVQTGTSRWSELLKALTFGIWSNTEVTLTVESSDDTCPIHYVGYYKAFDDHAYTEQQLAAVKWESFDNSHSNPGEKTLTVTDEERFTLYVKIEDCAGNCSYLSSTGIIVDKTPPNVSLAVMEQPNEHGYYNRDVPVKLNVNDVGISSGIRRVEYWVCSDDKETQREILYEAKLNAPSAGDLQMTFEKEVSISAAKNDSDKVVLYVEAVDYAGNVFKEQTEEIKIGATKPKIFLSYDKNTCLMGENGRGYFRENRTAVIQIQERSSTFDAESAAAGISISAWDAQGNEIPLDLGQMISNWETEEGAEAAAATHTARIVFDTDANYQVEVTYTNYAGNTAERPDTGDSTAPFSFTVDKEDPSGSIKIGENVWDRLLEILTFGLYSNTSFEAEAQAFDRISPVKIKYYKTNEVIQKNKEELDGIPESEWTDYVEKLKLVQEERFVIYLKIKDSAGHYIYVNSDGCIVDTNAPKITITADDANENGIYKQDVSLHIAVEDPQVYAGLKEVRYRVLCDNKVTEEETLFSFEKAHPVYADLQAEFSADRIVRAAENNSCNVKVEVISTDNAGNSSKEEMSLDIDITAPEIKLTYDKNRPNKEVNGRGYYREYRIAEIVIKERTHHFNPQEAREGITLKALDGRGREVTLPADMYSEWVTVPGQTPDEDTHKLTIRFTADANYELGISYTDKAGNAADQTDTSEQATPYLFTIDRTPPSASVSIRGKGEWSKLIETLTFGIWSNRVLEVGGTISDVTSPTEQLLYYKTPQTKALRAGELFGLSQWKAFSGLKIAPNERFTVYLKALDYAGNVSYVSTDGAIVDDSSPDVEGLGPQIALTPEENASGIYKDDVKVSVAVRDPQRGADGSYSGIKEIRYEVLNMGRQTQSGTLYQFYEKNPAFDELQQTWSAENAITVSKELNNSNDVKVLVYASDNADNYSQAQIELKIDATPPKITVEYDNNDGDTTFSDGVYFKNSRKAVITVEERNFDSEAVKVLLENEHGWIPALSEWTQTAGVKDNGDDTLHTAEILYDNDGDYTFDISCMDAAGNQNTEVDYKDSLAPCQFTVDRTMPEISVVYDNNDAKNVNYYKAPRKATITIREHNFETSRIDIALSASDNGKGTEIPRVSNWNSIGDVHTASILFEKDARYTFAVQYHDKAGNAAVPIQEQIFYVDKTRPTLTIQGISDKSANNDEGNIGFVITAKDTNFDHFKPVLTATVKTENGFSTTELNAGSMRKIENGASYVVNNLERDGIYRIACTLTDKAGNDYSEVRLERPDGSLYTEKRAGGDTLLTFSVNREGSVFEFTQDTGKMLRAYYVQEVPEDITFIEINADQIEKRAITINGQELKEGKDYRVSGGGEEGSWKQYFYSINKENFVKEKEYEVVLYSGDRAGNRAYSDVKDAAVRFVVDKTPPIVAVSGLEENGRYQTQRQAVTILPTDDGGALGDLSVQTVDENGQTIKELIKLSEDELRSVVEKNDGQMRFYLDEGLYQNVRVVCADCSVDKQGNHNLYDNTFTNVSVSTNKLLILWANRKLRYAVFGGACAVVVLLLLLLKARRTSKEEGE